MDLDALKQWIGRTEERQDTVTAAPVAMMSATLDRDDPQPRPGMPLPALWHWLYFTPQARQSDIGPDGHARRGGFLPPVALPRRMWAGGRLEFHRPLAVGEEVQRTSTIASVEGKQGRSGTLVFVGVHHDYRVGNELAIHEEHDIVYRDNPQPGQSAPPAQPAPTGETFSREIVPDPVLLFRYSALTFNGHRIHYDRTYVTEVEGYPGLIVHGPLIATLLVDLLRRQAPERTVRKFSFRAVRPVFDIHRFTVCGRIDDGGRATLWTRDHEGHLTMDATAELD